MAARQSDERTEPTPSFVADFPKKPIARLMPGLSCRRSLDRAISIAPAPLASDDATRPYHRRYAIARQWRCECRRYAETALMRVR